jgi:hypothetical protein
MKKAIYTLPFLFVAIDSRVGDTAFLIDETAVVVFGSERDHVICKSEIDRLGIDGRMLTKRDLIVDELLFQETIKYKIPIEDTIIDRYLDAMQKEHNLTLDQIKTIFRNAGYSYKEGREQLRRMYAGNVIIDNKIRTRLVVPENEVLAYYNDHPVVKEPKYCIQTGFIPYDFSIEKEAQKKIVIDAIVAGNAGMISWGDPFWLKQSELAEDTIFIASMKDGEVSLPHPTNRGFEVYRLVSFKPERLVPLHKRYRQIVSVLQRPKFEQMFAALQEDLLANACIIDFTMAN